MYSILFPPNSSLYSLLSDAIVNQMTCLHSTKKGFLQELKKVLWSGPGGEPFWVLKRTLDYGSSKEPYTKVLQRTLKVLSRTFV